MASPPQVKPRVKPRVKINSAQYFRPKPPSLRIGSEISRGAYGSVHSGELGGRPVAVKRIHRLLLEAARGQGDFDQVVADFKRECQLLEQIDHPHVVDFRGAFYDETTDGPVLVMEKMQENLLEFLKRSRNDLTLQKQLEICLAIVRGLRFLHTHTPPIVHRDLTDKNVLLGKDGLVKIGDLGQSRLKSNNAEYFSSAQPGAIPFMPPEAMQEESHYNEKLDVFSLGVLMLEVATQQSPRVKLVGIGTKKEVDRRKEDLAKLKEGHRLKPLIISCLKDDPQERPDIASIHDQLLDMVEGVETKTDGLRKQIASLQVALQDAREENAARAENEAKLTSQFQAELAARDTAVKQLVEKCERLEAQPVMSSWQLRSGPKPSKKNIGGHKAESGKPASRGKSPSESEKWAQKVRMSEVRVQELEEEPKVAGMYHSKELKRLTEKNQQLTERVTILEAANTRLEEANKSLREEVEHCDETKGYLFSQIVDLQAKHQTSSRSETKDHVAGATESTDGPPAPVGDLQSLGIKAEQQHTREHMKDGELAANAVRNQEVFLRQKEANVAINPLQQQTETPTVDGSAMLKHHDLDWKVQQLEAELDDVKKERDDLKHQVAEVRDECERAKHEAVVEAEKDRNLLLEETERFRHANESLSKLLSEKEDALKELQELRTTKALAEAMQDVPRVKQASVVRYERCHSYPLHTSDAVRKENSPSNSICQFAQGQQIEQMTAMQEALKECKEEIQRMEQELTESAQNLQKEQESKEKEVMRLKQQHQDEVNKLKTALKTAMQRSETKQEKREGMLGRMTQQHQAKVDEMMAKLKNAEDSSRQLEDECKRLEEMARKLKQKHQVEVDELKAKLNAAEDREKRFKTSNRLLVLTKDEELTSVNQKLQDCSQEVRTLQAKAEELSSQKSSLQVALREAREENVARTEHETKLTSQFQAEIADRNAAVKHLGKKCEQLEAQICDALQILSHTNRVALPPDVTLPEDANIPPVSTETLVEFIPEMAQKWEFIGHKLGLAHKIMALRNSEQSAESKCLAMLAEWVQAGREVTWQELLKVLTNSGILLYSVASRIRQHLLRSAS